MPVTISAVPKKLPSSRLGALGEPFTIASLLAAAGAAVVQNWPAIQDFLGKAWGEFTKWQQQNPGMPSPQDAAKPINAGQYPTKEQVQGYVAGLYARVPPGPRAGFAAALFTAVTTRTPDVERGFRDAAKAMPDLAEMRKNGFFGQLTFMEKFGTAVIVSSVLATVVVVGVITVKVVRRRNRGG